MATGDERNLFAGADTDDGLHFLGGTRQYDERRRFAQVRQRVTFVRQQLERLGQDGRVAADLPELGEKRIVHGL